MIIKNFKATFFWICQNSSCQTTSPIDSGSPKLLVYPFIPLLSILGFHVGEVSVVFTPVVEEIGEVVVYVPLEFHFKSFHGILFQC